MNKWTKVLGVVAATAMFIPLAACGGSDGGSSDTVKVGISMPEQMLERWKIDGENLKKQLEGYGYDVTLQYADGKTDLQTSQIQNMANNGMNYVVIASIDGTATGAARLQRRQGHCLRPSDHEHRRR